MSNLTSTPSPLPPFRKYLSAKMNCHNCTTSTETEEADVPRNILEDTLSMRYSRERLSPKNVLVSERDCTNRGYTPQILEMTIRMQEQAAHVIQRTLIITSLKIVQPEVPEVLVKKQFFGKGVSQKGHLEGG